MTGKKSMYVERGEGIFCIYTEEIERRTRMWIFVFLLEFVNEEHTTKEGKKKDAREGVNGGVSVINFEWSMMKYASEREERFYGKADIGRECERERNTDSGSTGRCT
jgi:hypothetical protein